MRREVGGRPRSDHFVLLTDPAGDQFVACDKKSCDWIRPVVRNSTLWRIENLTANHIHPEGWS